MTDVGKPATTYLPDRHRHVWDQVASEIVLERFAEGREGGVHAEASVWTKLPPNPGLLFQGRVNLPFSASSLEGLARMLGKRQPAVDWHPLLTQAAYYSVAQYREGDPMLELEDVAPSGGPRWLLEPFLERNGVTVLFAPGGSAKSTLAMAAAVSVASGQPLLGATPAVSGPVIYLDWEAEAETQHLRMRAIKNGAGVEGRVGIRYRREVASLHTSAEHLARRVAELGAVLVVIDSVGMARGGAPESAEDTIRLFQAVRQLGVPALLVDHVTKASLKAKDRHAFGSVYTENLARLAWSAHSGQSGEAGVSMHLRNTKANNGRLAEPRAFTFLWEGEGITVMRDRYELPATSTSTSTRLADQVEEWLADQGPQTTAQLAAATGTSESSIRQILSRNAERFHNMGTDRKALWQLRSDDQRLVDPY